MLLWRRERGCVGGARLWTELLIGEGRRLPRDRVLCGAVPAAATAAVTAATAAVAATAPLAAAAKAAAVTAATFSVAIAATTVAGATLAAAPLAAAAESGAALTLAAASVGVAVAATLPAAAIALVAALSAAPAALSAAAVAGDAAAPPRPATTVSGDATAATLRGAVPTAMDVASDPLALWWSAELNSVRVLHVWSWTRTLRGKREAYYTSSVRMIEPRTRRGARISCTTPGCILWASPRPRRLRKLIRGERTGVGWGVGRVLMGCGEGSDGVTPKPTAQRPARGAKPLGPGAYTRRTT